ncbi:MAG: tape measure protein [Bacteroidaceae bacterium]|nr:tape measure protein [Bacteroidaceae bacterium]
MASTGSDYVLRVELDEFKKQMQEASNQFKKVGDQATKEGNKIDGALKKVGMAVGAYFATAQLQAFAQKVIQVRSEVEKLQVSFKTLAGAEAGGKLFEEIRQFAAATPLLVKDLASAAQTMLGFGISAEKVMPNLRAIGDISMGDAQKLQSLSLAFSQMTATGKLMGQDLLQMINAGFNPLEEISRKTGQSIGVLKEKMSEGAISAEMVRDAFMSATSEGGKFNGMLEAQSKTIAGQMSNLEGAMDDAMNAIGENFQPIIVEAIGGLTELVKNFDTVGKVILTCVEAVGAYKAAELVSIAITKRHTIAVIAQTVAQTALNAVMALNPYVAATMAVVALAAAIYTWTDRTTAQERAEERLRQRNKDLEEALDDRREASEALLSVVTDETKTDNERSEALQKLKEREAAVFEKYDTFIELTNKRTEAQKKLNEAIRDEANAQKERGYEADKKALEVIKDYEKNPTNSYAWMRVQGEFEKDTGKNAAGRGDEITKWMSEIKKRINIQDRERSTSAQSSYLASISSMSIDAMKEEETHMKSLLNQAKKQNKEYILTNGILVSRAQLVERINKLQERQKEQGVTSNPYKEALGEWEKATKKIKDLQRKANTSLTKEERTKLDEELKAQEAALKTAKEKLESYGWNDPSKNKGQDRTAEVKSKQQREAERAERDTQLAIEKARVDAMTEGKAKTLKQIDIEYEAEMNRINDWYDDLIVQRVQREEELWKANPQNKDKKFVASASAYEHTAEDNSQYVAQLENAQNKRNKAITKANEEERKANEQAMREYLREFGTYEEKRLAITQEYAQKIKDAKTEGEKLTLGEQEKAEIQELEEQFGRAAQALSDLFGDAAKKSTAEIEKIIAKYRELLEYMQGKKSQEELISGGNWTQTELTGAVDKVKSGKVDVKGLDDLIKKFEDSLKARDPFTPIKDAFQKIRNAAKDGNVSFKDLGVGLSEASDAVADYLLPNLNKIGDAVTTIFGEGAGNVVKDATSLVSGALGMGKGVGQIMSGDILGGVASAMSGFAEIFSTISSWGVTDNIEEMNRAIAQATESIDNFSWAMNEYINDLKESTSNEAYSNYKSAAENLGRQMKSYKDIIRSSESVYSSDNWLGFGGRDSILYHLQKGGYDENGIFQTLLSRGYKKDLADWSAEDWHNLRKSDAALYSELQSLITEIGESEGWEEYAEKINNAADAMSELSGKQEELRDALKENVTGISFDAMEDEFKSVLSDMESDAEDFTNMFQRHINDVSFRYLTEQMSDELDAYYNALYNAASNGGIDATEAASLAAMRQEIIDETMKQRELLKEAGAIKDTNESTGAQATTRGISNIREDQADVMNGRLTYIQSIVTQQLQQIIEQKAIASGIKSIVDSYQDLLFDSNQRLRDIAENTRELYAIRQALNDIRTNTDRL